MSADLIIRRPQRHDSYDMADLLNEIIALGGTTARQSEVSAAEIWEEVSPPKCLLCHLAEENGQILGFQTLSLWPDLPPEACDIATFVVEGRQQMGIGSALFAETAQAARKLGLEWICAAIRTDNAGGLAYYQSRGFRRYGQTAPRKRPDGRVITQVLTRYDLD